MPAGPQLSRWSLRGALAGLTTYTLLPRLCRYVNDGRNNRLFCGNDVYANLHKLSAIRQQLLSDPSFVHLPVLYSGMLSGAQALTMVLMRDCFGI